MANSVMVSTPLNVPVTSVTLIGTVIAFVPALGGAATPADANASTPTIAASAARPVSRRVFIWMSSLQSGTAVSRPIGRQAPAPIPVLYEFQTRKRPVPSPEEDSLAATTLRDQTGTGLCLTIDSVP